MKTLNALATFTLAAAVAIGASGSVGAQSSADLVAAAKKEGKLTFYTEQPVETITGLIAAFSAKYPGITVDYFRGQTSQLVTRYESETAAGRHIVDVFTATERRAKLMKPNLLANFKSPELARYDAGVQPTHGNWAVYSLNTTSFAWNPRTMPKGQEPKEWKDLLDPKWKGKIGIQDPAVGGGAASWIATMYGVWGEAEWLDYMTKFAAQNLLYATRPQVEEKVMSGELAIIAVDYPDFIEPLKAKGAPIEWGTPKPMIRTGLSIQLSPNAPNPNAAKLFINFLLSEEGQQTLAKLGSMPALKSAWPAVFDRMKTAELVPSADELEAQKADYFSAKIKELFGKR